MRDKEIKREEGDRDEGEERMEKEARKKQSKKKIAVSCCYCRYLALDARRRQKKGN